MVNVDAGFTETTRVCDGGGAVIGTTVVNVDVGLREMYTVSAKPARRYDGNAEVEPDKDS